MNNKTGKENNAILAEVGALVGKSRIYHLILGELKKWEKEDDDFVGYYETFKAFHNLVERHWDAVRDKELASYLKTLKTREERYFVMAKTLEEHLEYKTKEYRFVYGEYGGDGNSLYSSSFHKNGTRDGRPLLAFPTEEEAQQEIDHLERESDTYTHCVMPEEKAVEYATSILD